MNIIETFSGRNAEIAAEYQRALELEGLRQVTIIRNLRTIRILHRFFNTKPFDILSKTEIEDFILHRKKITKQSTLNTNIVVLMKFYKWLKPNKNYFDTIKIKPYRNYLPVEQLIIPEDIKRMLNVCESQRDRALIMVLWDLGCRLSELQDRNINHIEYDEYGATLIVKGKTGMRKLRLIESLPDLRAWLNQHPDKNNPNAPLFVTNKRVSSGRQGIGRHRMRKENIGQIIRDTGELAKLNKRCHPHALRHGRLTFFVKQGFLESELRIIAGWSRDSKMPAIYVHLAGVDVDRKRLIISGIIKKEDITNPLMPLKCPRCAFENPCDAKYCTKCNLIFDSAIAREVEEKSKLIPEAYTMLGRNPDFQRFFKSPILN